MKPKVICYMAISEDGRSTGFDIDLGQYYGCRGNDLVTQQMGEFKAREFPEMAGAKNDEDVWFSFIVFESKEHRDEINAKVMEWMKEYEEKNGPLQMPFDVSRMAYGGFEARVEG